MLELSALVAMGAWGWGEGIGWYKSVFALVTPIIAASIWGIFNVLDDPSRNGRAPIAVSGNVRLVIELLFFFVAAWMLYDVGYAIFGLALIVITILHYLASYRRIIWLISH